MEDNKFNIVMPQNDRIMSYFRGQMTAEEETAFLEEVKNNNALRENVVAVARISKAMNKVGKLNDGEIMSALLATSKANAKNIAKRVSSNRKAMIRRFSYISSIAASVIFIVFVGLQYNSYHKTTSLGDEYAMAFEASITVRGDVNAKVQEELKRLFDDVVERNYPEQTIKRLSTLWELSTMDVYNDYTDYSQEIGWNLAIAYLKDNDKELAKEILQKLVLIAGNDSVFGKRAIELLEKVNAL